MFLHRRPAHRFRYVSERAVLTCPPRPVLSACSFVTSWPHPAPLHSANHSNALQAIPPRLLPKSTRSSSRPYTPLSMFRCSPVCFAHWHHNPSAVAGAAVTSLDHPRTQQKKRTFFEMKRLFGLFHIWVKRNFFFSVVGALVKKCPVVGKLKQIRGFVGEIQAKRSSVGEIETKTAFCG